MLQSNNIFSGFSIDNSEKARHFYSEILGLTVKPVEGMEEMGMLELHTNGNNPILMYPKPDHVPATYTILNFPVNDIEATLKVLQEKGVEFENVPGIEQDGMNIMRGKAMGMGPDIAWFKDPAGNSLSIMSE